MYKKNNKTCYTCGKVYTYCPSCGEFAHLPKWHNMFHDENCMKIFDVASAYATGLASPVEAADFLKECDIAIEINNPVLKKQLDEIFSLAEKEKEKETDTLPKAKKTKSVNVSKDKAVPEEGALNK